MENKQDKGFTLVELLIVIVILGILATVTVFAVRGITDRGQENACAVDSRTLETSIEAFYAQEQRDPIDESELTVGPYVDPDATTLVRVANPEPILKEAPSNFEFAEGPPATYTATAGGDCAEWAAANP
jgi:prepilin-type N-terminal cleavage/methylation domain-containing protein